MRKIQEQTLERIDQALEYLYRDRLDYIREVDRKYSEYRKTKNLGIEATLSAEFYSALQRQFSVLSVFMEFPGLDKDRIDLLVDGYLNDLDYRGYIELKMFYSRDPKCYTHDFEKLRQMVVTDNDAVAIQVHFEMYGNKNQPNHRLIDGFASSLDVSAYWSEIKTIGDEKGEHFYRFAFGYRRNENNGTQVDTHSRAVYVGHDC